MNTPLNLGSKERLKMLNELVDEITKENYDVDKVKALTKQLNITYVEDEMLLLNNILKGIHAPEVDNGAQL